MSSILIVFYQCFTILFYYKPRNKNNNDHSNTNVHNDNNNNNNNNNKTRELKYLNCLNEACRIWLTFRAKYFRDTNGPRMENKVEEGLSK